MNYLYLGLDDLYLPAAAAAIHLQHKFPTEEELLQLPYFSPARPADEGRLLLAGRDAEGRKVYLAFVSGHPDIFVRGLQSLLGIFKLPREAMQVIPVLPQNPRVGSLCRLLVRMGLPAAANSLGLRLVHNRKNDLLHIADCRDKTAGKH
ncbi:MAG TPA: DUF3189 family protein [Firmicutes bacterium]|nr:DUF3189 family protein [Bacillota bacterium]